MTDKVKDKEVKEVDPDTPEYVEPPEVTPPDGTDPGDHEKLLVLLAWATHVIDTNVLEEVDFESLAIKVDALAQVRGLPVPTEEPEVNPLEQKKAK